MSTIHRNGFAPFRFLAPFLCILPTQNGREPFKKGDHTGFNVHSKVRTTSKEEAERVGKYMIRPILLSKEALLKLMKLSLTSFLEIIKK